ncbi:hypothetical protein E2C01_056459 [Portunus trituberculatus]|uniref:Uncharacterized protein n=1 Tax=Portunus trituberculatus TaxID=210409 RepID=A0A5B7H0K8_PORTR|nr:hypothetical protein [Portunus trituberculatus]
MVLRIYSNGLKGHRWREEESVGWRGARHPGGQGEGDKDSHQREALQKEEPLDLTTSSQIKIRRPWKLMQSH